MLYVWLVFVIENIPVFSVKKLKDCENFRNLLFQLRQSWEN